MAQNIARGGLYNSLGEYGDRWPQLAERINSIKPDILLLSELNRWQSYGNKQLVRATNDLDMNAAPISPSQTGYATGLMYRQQTVGRWQYHNSSVAHETTHGFAVTGFDVGLPTLLNIAPVHLCFYSADKASNEAQLVISKAYARTPFAIIGGDCNCSPAKGPEPDYSSSKPYNLSARTVIDTGEDVKIADLKSNRKTAWTFIRGGFVDAADHLFGQTKDSSLLEPTAANERIDQFWVSQALAPAILEYSLTRLHPTSTDHAGIVIKLDIDKVDTSNIWETELL